LKILPNPCGCQNKLKTDRQICNENFSQEKSLMSIKKRENYDASKSVEIPESMDFLYFIMININAKICGQFLVYFDSRKDLAVFSRFSRTQFLHSYI
jgi:hypothetical protein